MTPLTLNEIGAICLGYTFEDIPIGRVWSLDGNELFKVEFNERTDITLSDPPTDAQLGNMLRLWDAAYEADAARCLELLCACVPCETVNDLDGCATYQESDVIDLIGMPPKDIRNTALRVLAETFCPKHRDELERLLEGV